MEFLRTEKQLRERRQGVRVFGGFLMVFAMGCVGMSIVTMFQTTWPTTMAHVTETEVVKEAPVHESEPSEQYKARSGAYDKDGKRKHPKKPDYVLKVAYKYTVDGEEFTNKDRADTAKDSSKLESLASDKYPVGKKIQIAYDPNNHTESRLHAATWFYAIMLLVMAGGIGFGAFKMITLKEPVKVQSEDF